MRRGLAIAIAFTLSCPACAATLYKSVDPSGTVMFSDTPPGEGARILEERVIGESSSSYGAAMPAAPYTGLEEAFAQIDYDAALAQANARLDMAERALAQARNGAASRYEGLRLPVSTQAANPSTDHIEFCKRDVKIARQALMDLLRSRQLASGRQVKGS